MTYKKDISVVYKQCTYSGDESHSLETLLSQLFESSPNVQDRLINVDLASEILFASLDSHPLNKGVFLRAFIFDHGAMGMINFGAARNTASLEELLPPEGKKFLKKEIVFLVQGNMIYAAGMRGANSLISRLLCNIFDRRGVTQKGFLLLIDDVPKQSSIDELRESGVKSIDLNITDYLENLPEARELPPLLKAILARPINQADARKRDNAIGKLTLNRGRILKKEEIDKDLFLTGIGEEILQVEPEDYTIRLENGRTLTPKNFKISKTYKVPAFANTTSYEHVKQAITDFARTISRGP